jgi:nitrate/TMAO reductase-like tetraheme cytochrome c subunit
MGFSLLTILFIVGYYVFAYSGSMEYISNDQADCTTCHRAPESEIN